MRLWGCVLCLVVHFRDKRVGDGSPHLAHTLTRSRVVPVGRSCASCEAWLADERFMQTIFCLQADF
jgi:hypothetical protein